jgi:hypothetical protein
LTPSVDNTAARLTSRSDALKDHVGLKAFTSVLKTVVSGYNRVPRVSWLGSAVLPVGCPPSKLKSGSEKVDPVAVVVGVEELVLDGH